VQEKDFKTAPKTSESTPNQSTKPRYDKRLNNLWRERFTILTNHSIVLTHFFLRIRERVTQRWQAKPGFKKQSEMKGKEEQLEDGEIRSTKEVNNPLYKLLGGPQSEDEGPEEISLKSTKTSSQENEFQQKVETETKFSQQMEKETKHRASGKKFKGNEIKKAHTKVSLFHT
jgi:hypothetical protein